MTSEQQRQLCGIVYKHKRKLAYNAKTKSPFCQKSPSHKTITFHISLYSRKEAMFIVL